MNLKQDLKDTPFAIERLFVWGIGIVMIVGMISMAIIGYEGRTIPPQLQSVVMICIGAFVARIERRK